MSSFELRAGPVQLTLEPASPWARWWRCGEIELLRAVYPAHGLLLHGARGASRLLVGNLAAAPRTLRLCDLPSGRPAPALLFQATSSRAGRTPRVARTRSGIAVTLPACAVLQLDFPPRR